jgi:RNA polymerase sigma factor (sigma-70 family)
MTDFNTVEQEMRPIAIARAKRYGLDVDDAVQESRIAMYKAMERYDETRPFKPYMAEVITNTCKSMYGHSRSGIRCPSVFERDEVNGGWKESRRSPVSLSVEEDEGRHDWHPVSTDCPESEVDDATRERACAAFVAKALANLAPKERAALQMRLASFTSSSVAMAKSMGILKNEFDWIVVKMRYQLTKMATEEDTPLSAHADGRDWPQIHTSVGVRYHGNFAARTMKLRARVPSREGVLVMEECSAGIRVMERHPWGCVMVCLRQGRVYTSVIEGRLNPRSGEIHGVHFTKLFVDVPGYPAIAKGLASPGAMRRVIGSLEEIKVGGE